MEMTDLWHISLHYLLPIIDWLQLHDREVMEDGGRGQEGKENTAPSPGEWTEGDRGGRGERKKFVTIKFNTLFKNNVFLLHLATKDVKRIVFLAALPPFP